MTADSDEMPGRGPARGDLGRAPRARSATRRARFTAIVRSQASGAIAATVPNAATPALAITRVDARRSARRRPRPSRPTPAASVTSTSNAAARVAEALRPGARARRARAPPGRRSSRERGAGGPTRGPMPRAAPVITTTRLISSCLRPAVSSCLTMLWVLCAVIARRRTAVGEVLVATTAMTIPPATRMTASSASSHLARAPATTRARGRRRGGLGRRFRRRRARGRRLARHDGAGRPRRPRAAASSSPARRADDAGGAGRRSGGPGDARRAGRRVAVAAGALHRAPGASRRRRRSARAGRAPGRRSTASASCGGTPATSSSSSGGASRCCLSASSVSDCAS